MCWCTACACDAEIGLKGLVYEENEFKEPPYTVVGCADMVEQSGMQLCWLVQTCTLSSTEVCTFCTTAHNGCSTPEPLLYQVNWSQVPEYTIPGCAEQVQKSYEEICSFSHIPGHLWPGFLKPTGPKSPINYSYRDGKSFPHCRNRIFASFSILSSIE